MGERGDNLAPEFDEVFAVVDGARAVGLPAAVVGKHQVDIGGIVEFAAAQFAQPERHHADRRAVLVSRRAEALAEPAVVVGERAVDTALGERRHAFHGLVEAARAAQVTPRQPHHFAAANRPQARVQLGLVAAVSQFALNPAAQLRAAATAVEFAGIDEPGEQRWRSDARAGDKLAARPHPRQLGAGRGGRQRRRITAACLLKPPPRLRDRLREFGRRGL